MIDPEQASRQARKPLELTLPSKKVDETEIKTNFNSYQDFMKTAQNTKEANHHAHVEEVKQEDHGHGHSHEHTHEEHAHHHDHDHGDEEANVAVTKENLNEYF